MYNRHINLLNTEGSSFFLWGPRQTGKSTLLKATYPGALSFNLLDSDIFSRFIVRPAQMREEILAYFHLNPSADKFVVIDEIQKIPALTDEVHLLIENHGIRFCLCGSSARKLRKVHANMLKSLPMSIPISSSIVLIRALTGLRPFADGKRSSARGNTRPWVQRVARTTKTP